MLQDLKNIFNLKGVTKCVLHFLQELLRQREVIQNIEKKTDEINSTLTTSQRHINNIKSVFGGIKNWWAGKKDASSAASEEKRGSSLDSIVKRNPNSAAALSSSRSLEGEGSRGWGEGGSVYQRDADLDSRFMASAASSRYDGAGGGSSSLQYVQPITRSAREEELDKNLGWFAATAPVHLLSVCLSLWPTWDVWICVHMHTCHFMDLIYVCLVLLFIGSKFITLTDSLYQAFLL